MIVEPDHAMIDFDTILAEVHHESLPLIDQGAVANYIPALANIDAEQFGIALAGLDDAVHMVGDAQQEFSIQSISKVFVLAMVFKEIGAELWHRVGREPSGDPFNSLVQLEYESGIPRNPFINAGALVLADCLISCSANPKQDLLNYVRRLCGNNQVDYDLEVADSERAMGFRNVALANFIKSFGNINNDVDEVLDVYFHQCALKMNCLDLARAFRLFANGGVNPLNNERVLTARRTKRINAIMQMCGFYDESGEFAFTVGLPGKSGVGGGIVAVIPGSLAICVWSPRLNNNGNSVVGMKALESFTTKSGVSIF